MSAPTAYRIKNWDAFYEVSDSRKVSGPLTWVAVRTKHDGRGFRRIAAQKERSVLFATWILMVEIAAKLPRNLRGWLVDAHGRPLDAEDLALKTGWATEDFERALAFFSDPKQEWIEKALPPSFQSGDQRSNPEASDSFRTDSEASGHGAPTGQDTTGQNTPPIAPRAGGEAGGGSQNDRGKAGRSAAGRPAYPDALAFSPAFIACWEGEWLPYLLQLRKRKPTEATIRSQLAICARLGPERAIAGIQTAIMRGYAAPVENAPLPPVVARQHLLQRRPWDDEPEGWRDHWSAKYPPEQFPKAPRYEEGKWSEIPNDHRKMIWDSLQTEKKQHRRAG